MESINSNKIKRSFKSFSLSNNFKYFDSDPIVAPSGSKLLFNISGGVKYQDELLGLTKPNDDRVSSIQKCVRTDNLDKIGFSCRHHLFFEMLGHFMLYCDNEKRTKEHFIQFAYKFLFDELNLDKKRLYVTVHPEDLVTLDIWKKIGVSNIIYQTQNIFISPYAEKSALRTEILWQQGAKENELVELWNLVFTQFNSKKIFENSSDLIAADSGVSLERIVSAYENKTNNYENSMWNDFINDIFCLGTFDDINYARRIADFTNTVSELISEGIIPGNKVQNSLVRKMLRILYDLCDDYNISIDNLINLYFNNTNIKNILFIKRVILEEQEKYLVAIENGLKQAQKMIKKKNLTIDDCVFLKSSYGLRQKYIEQLFNENGSVKKLIK